MWLDVSVADALGMYVRKRSEELVDVQLDFENRHRCFHLVEITRSSVDGLGNEFEDEVEVDFVFLAGVSDENK